MRRAIFLVLTVVGLMLAGSGLAGEIITARTVTDIPDPFSPPGQTTTITGTFDYLALGRNQDRKTVTRTWEVRMDVALIDAQGNAVRNIQASAPGEPPQKTAVISATWDGCNEQGELLPAGTYTYSVRGSLLFTIEVHTRWFTFEREVVVGQSNTLTGTVTVDSAPVDTTPPVVENIIPSARVWFSDPYTEIGAFYTDAESGIDVSAVRLFVDSSEVAVSATATEVFYAPSEGFSDGSHSILLIVADLAGNTATAEWEILVDTIAPEVLSFTPLMTEDSDPTIIITAVDDGSGINADSIQLLIDAVRIETFYSEGIIFAFPYGLAPGVHTVVISMADYANNSNQFVFQMFVEPGAAAPTTTSLQAADGLAVETASRTTGNGNGDSASSGGNKVADLVDSVQDLWTDVWGPCSLWAGLLPDLLHLIHADDR